MDALRANKRELLVQMLETSAVALESMGYGGFARDARDIQAGRSNHHPLDIIKITIKALEREGFADKAQTLLKATRYL